LRGAKGDDLGPVSHGVDLVAPPLHHPNTLIPIVAARISAADFILIDVALLAFDRVIRPKIALIQKAAGAGSESMWAMGLGRDAYCAESRTPCRVRYGPLG